MCSHKDMDFENECFYFLHATNLDLNEEASDMYLQAL